MKEIKIGGQTCVILRASYMNGGVALEALCAKDTIYEGEPWARLTVNIPGVIYHDWLVTLDTNNVPTVLEDLQRESLGQVAGYVPSGFCVYPLFCLDLEKLNEYSGTEEEIRQYFNEAEVQDNGADEQD